MNKECCWFGFDTLQDACVLWFVLVDRVVGGKV